MGAVSSIIKSIDPAKPIMADMQAQIDIIYDLGMTHAESQENKIMQSLRTASTQENKTIAVGNILTIIKEVKATTSTDPGTIVDNISQGVQSIVSGDVAKGVTNIILQGMSVLLGKGQA